MVVADCLWEGMCFNICIVLSKLSCDWMNRTQWLYECVMKITSTAIDNHTHIHIYVKRTICGCRIGLMLACCTVVLVPATEKMNE